MSETDKTDGSQRVRFLNDLPVQDDRFVGRAHDRAARALATAIAISGSGGNAIGLEGAWGSGKSTVIAIAKNIFKSLDNDVRFRGFEVFTFDMWAHQEDSLRRAFLEEFLSWLSKNKFIKQEYVDGLSAEINKRKKNITTTTTKKFTKSGIAFLFLAPILPISYIWLSPVAFQDTVQHILSFNTTSIDIRKVAFVSVVSIYAIAIFSWLFNGLKDFGGSVSFLSKESAHEIRNESISDDIPTTIEFNNIFDKIVRKAINNIKFVVVLDNIDRLPSEKIRDAWATMRNFFISSAESKRLDVLRNLWVIVPYDRIHLGSIFNGDSDKNARDSLLKEYISKTFDVVIRVSPPLLSDWRVYFMDMLDEAFCGVIDKSDYHNLYRLLEVHSIEYAYVITPRIIKKYINDIVSVYIQWGDNIPIQCVAIFILFKDSLERNLNLLKSEKLFSERIAGLLYGVEWPKYVAAIYFNVEPDQAYEFLLGDDIERALIQGDIDKLKSLARSRGFLLILCDLVGEKSRDWAAGDFGGFCSICRVIRELKIDADMALAEIWHALASATASLDQWSSVNEEVGKGVVALLSSVDENERGNVARNVIKNLEENGSGNALGEFDSGRIWVAIVDSICGFLDKDLMSGITIRVPGAADFYCGGASAARDLENLGWDQFNPSINATALADQVVAYIGSPKAIHRLTEVIEGICSNPAVCAWDKVVSACVARLEGKGADSNVSEYVLLLNVLLRLTQISAVSGVSGKAKAALETLFKNGTLPALVMLGLEQKSPELIGCAFWCSALTHGLDLRGYPTSHPKWGTLTGAAIALQQIQTSPASYREVVEQVVATVIRFDSFSVVLSWAVESRNESEFFKAVVRGVVRRDGYKSLTIQNVFKDYDAIANILGDNLEDKFIRRFGDWSSYFSKNVGGEATRYISSRFIEKAAKIDSLGMSVVIKIVKEYLSKKCVDSWRKSLDAEDDDLRLLIVTVKAANFELPPGNIRGPLVDKIRVILETGNFPKQSRGRWSVIPYCLAKRSRSAFCGDVWSILCSKRWNVSRVLGVIELLGEAIGEKIPSERYGDLIVQNIVAPIIGEAPDDGLKWVNENSAQIGLCVEKSSPETKELLREYMVGGLNGASKNREKILRKLSRSWGIKVRKNIIRRIIAGT